MSDAARRMRANRLTAGQACAACGRVLVLGDDVAVCGACQAPHDAPCWDREGGCATPGCANAPLARLAEPPRAAGGSGPLPLGKKACPHCGKVIRSNAPLCPHCKEVPTADGVYRGPTQNAPGAVASMVLGIVGLFVCGVILGILAIVKSSEARKAIASNPRYVGGGYATAGLVMGIVDLAAWAIFLLWKLSETGRGY